VFREISPYAILLSGGQGSVADLFGWKGRKDKAGLVVRYDLVAFDEVAGPNFKSESDKQMYKGYMEQGSFSRGDDKGTIQADAGSFSTVTSKATSLHRPYHAPVDAAAGEHSQRRRFPRPLARLPAWLGSVQARAGALHHAPWLHRRLYCGNFHNVLRPLNYTDAYDRYFAFGNHVGGRDRKAAVRTISGLLKLLHPDGNAPKTSWLNTSSSPWNCAAV